MRSSRNVLVVTAALAAFGLAAGPSRADEAPAIGCDWPAVDDANTTNVLWPDEGANYWLTTFPAIAGTRVRIDGQMPDARYFSFHAYDAISRPIDSIADYEITAIGDGTKPSETPPTAPGTGYTVYVSLEPRPATPAPNTIYAGEFTVSGATRAPNPMVTMLYRIYVPSGNDQGGAELPALTIETADGNSELFRFGRCGPFTSSNDVPFADGINEAVKAISFPSQAAIAPYILAPSEPSFERFYNLAETFRQFAANAVENLGGEPPARDPGNPVFANAGGGFLSNTHNAYLVEHFSREHGSAYVVRAKAPTVPGDDRLGTQDVPDLRYWSVCSNDFPTTRYVQCVTDLDAQVGSDGYFTFIVSDEAPANAAYVNWLDWGGAYYDSLIIYRHMLPAAGFTGAAQRVGYTDDPAAVMGTYYPRAVYCDPATIAALNLTADPNPGKAIFEACGG